MITKAQYEGATKLIKDYNNQEKTIYLNRISKIERNDFVVYAGKDTKILTSGNEYRVTGTPYIHNNESAYIRIKTDSIYGTCVCINSRLITRINNELIPK